ncbi:MAG: hypothetical protein ACUVYA_14545 [Planctomycetota bacterium]
MLEFCFQVRGSTLGSRSDYFLESVRPGSANDPGLIYDYTPDDYIEMFRGARTGTAGPQVGDEEWHHIVFAFYGNSAGFGVANRRDIVIDGGEFPRYVWSVVSGDAAVADRGGGEAEVAAASAGTVVVRVEAANANDDDSINITDGIFVLNYLFLGGPAPAPPGPPEEPCGPDPQGSPTNLGCASYPHC